MGKLIEGIVAVLILGAACFTAKAEPIAVWKCAQPGLTTSFLIGGGVKESGSVANCSNDLPGGASGPTVFPEYQFFHIDTGETATPGILHVTPGTSDLHQAFFGQTPSESPAVSTLLKSNLTPPLSVLTATPEPTQYAALLGAGFAIALLRRRISSAGV